MDESTNALLEQEGDVRRKEMRIGERKREEWMTEGGEGESGLNRMEEKLTRSLFIGGWW